MPTYDKDVLSGPEERALNYITNADGLHQLETCAPGDIDTDLAFNALCACCRELVHSRKMASYWKIAIGKLLLVVQRNPASFLDRGYNNFDDFMSRGVMEMLGIPRSEAYNAARISKAWPSITLEEAEEITYSKLSLITSFTSEGAADAEKWLLKARSMTVDELKDDIHARGIIKRSDMDLVPLTLAVKKEVRKLWREFVADPRVISKAESTDPGTIFEMLIADARSGPDWLAKEEAIPASYEEAGE